MKKILTLMLAMAMSVVAFAEGTPYFKNTLGASVLKIGSSAVDQVLIASSTGSTLFNFYDAVSATGAVAGNLKYSITVTAATTPTLYAINAAFMKGVVVSASDASNTVVSTTFIKTIGNEGKPVYSAVSGARVMHAGKTSLKSLFVTASTGSVSVSVHDVSYTAGASSSNLKAYIPVTATTGNLNLAVNGTFMKGVVITTAGSTVTVTASTVGVPLP